MSSDFETFEREILSEKIAARILTLIKERRLQPGDKLPPERELAEIMGVSRPSLREALRALSLMNFLEIRQGSGTYITSLEPELLVEHLDFVFALEDTTYLELLRARKVLEGGLAEMAAKNISEVEVKKLEECLERSIKTIDDPQDFLQTDLELHKIICNAAKNNILARLMASINKLAIHSRQRTTEIRKIRERTVRDHKAIIAAIRSGDPKAARQAMVDHLEYVEKRLTESIE